MTQTTIKKKIKNKTLFENIINPRNYADYFSLTRLLLTPLAYSLENRLQRLVFLSIIGLTDVVDGMLARHFGGNPWGASLDAMVDKIFFGWVALAATECGVYNVPLLLLITLRDNIASILRGYAQKYKTSIKTSFVGKLKANVLPWSISVVYLDASFDVMNGIARSGFIILTVILTVVFGRHRKHFSTNEYIMSVIGLIFLGFSSPWFISSGTTLAVSHIYFSWGSVLLYFDQYHKKGLLKKIVKEMKIRHWIWILFVLFGIISIIFYHYNGFQGGHYILSGVENMKVRKIPPFWSMFTYGILLSIGQVIIFAQDLLYLRRKIKSKSG